MFYLVKTPWLIKKILFPKYIWNLPEKKKKVYLTFDDGPHPVVTNFVLEELQKFDAKATFFCIGKNVLTHPEIFKLIIRQGHSIGNHTHNHMNGWKTSDELYLKNIIEASRYIDSNLFRPPYGRITFFQAKQVMEKMNLKIIMWSVLSGDFDLKLTAEECYQNVINASVPGSVIVFHDSEKSYPILKIVLPRVLEYFKNKNYEFSSISL
jgi:peptidoglycan/xylan/chitin deacetylase (PgdA/CDA1 family)